MKSALCVVFLAFLPSMAQADPNPDRLGICYVFEKAGMKKTAPCVIQSGSDDKGNFYTVLNNIADIPLRIDDNIGAGAPRVIIVDGKEGEVFMRNASGQEISREDATKAAPEEHEQFLTCFRGKDNPVSYCFKRSMM